jgi:predicted nucleic acid-binding protein
LDTWLIDTALFKSLAPGGPKGATLRSWIETHEDPLFLSAAFLVELKAVINKIRGRETKRAEALQAWFDGLVTTFSDRIHPIDIHVAVRAGSLLPYRQEGLPRDRFYDVVLAATAQIHGHGLLTKRVSVIGA